MKNAENNAIMFSGDFMFSILLAIIYLAFISLGLPDSLLGSAWPVMNEELSVPLSYAGMLTMIISGGTIISSLFSGRVINRFGTGLVTAISVALTALALLGFSLADTFTMLCVLAVPYGFGAGAVDAALNNYVALHYSSRQMSWLHAFWGVGVSISPNIMSFCLFRNYGWHTGYRIVFILQTVLVIILFLSLPLWESGNNRNDGSTRSKTLTISQALRIKGVPYVLVAFFCFCSVEATAGLWASTYMVEHHHLDVETAALFGSFFYIGEMSGRFLNGFVADRFGDKRMVRIGILTIIAGIILLSLPFESNILSLVSLLIIGLGAAPIYPCIIHSTPDNFGKENSQSLIGLQMACAYIGCTFMPPVFGLIAQHISVALYPAFLALFTVLMLFMTIQLNKKCR